MGTVLVSIIVTVIVSLIWFELSDLRRKIKELEAMPNMRGVDRTVHLDSSFSNIVCDDIKENKNDK